MALGALVPAMTLAAIDQTILAAALPAIGGELGGSAYEPWVVTAYMLAVIVSAVLWGRLGSRVGRKPLFMGSIAVFAVGSALCGLAWSLHTLIAFRGLQGIGGGGLIVLTQVIARDLVPPRERGRCQGMFGAVFGVSSVVGPLFGGLFVDHLSWRWIFLVNLPVAVIILGTTAIVLPRRPVEEGPTAGRLGRAMPIAVAVCMGLVVVPGVIRHSWAGPMALATGAVVVMLAVAWSRQEHGVPEPVLPLRLLRDPVFSISGGVGFIVGFVIFGCLVYLPVLLRLVAGVPAAGSGLSVLPMVLGLLAMSVLSGHLIGATGTYRLSAVAGMALTALGLLLCSRMDGSTPVVAMGLCLGVLGCGLGLVVQVPIIAVQNTVGYRDLGAATSGVTLVRAFGGLTGVMAFSAVLDHQLHVRMVQAVRAVRLPPGLDAESLQLDPMLLSRLPSAERAPFADALAQSAHSVFVWTIPMALAGVVLGTCLRRVPLRATAGGMDLGECLGGAPTVRSSREEIERMLSRLMRSDPDARDKVKEVYRSLGAPAGVDCPPESLWALCRIARAGAAGDPVSPEAGGVADPGRRFLVDRLVAEGLVVRTGEQVQITDAGQAVAERLYGAMRDTMARLLRGWSPEDSPELLRLLARLSRESLGDDADLPILRADAGVPPSRDGASR
jgi:EmrB/QacA subfamily drug resistance transporter